MKRHHAWLGLVGLVSFGYGLNGCDGRSPSAEKATVEQSRAYLQTPGAQARQALAMVGRPGTPTDALEVVSQVKADEITQMKLLDKTSRQIKGVNLDATGNEASPDQVATALQRLRARDFVGSVESSLARKVEAAPSATHKAIVWTKTTGDAPRIDRRALERGEAKAQIDTLKAFNKSKTSAIKSFVEAQQGKVTYQSAFAPLVAVSVPGQTIAELAKRDDVDVVYDVYVYQSELNTSVPTIGVPFAWGKGMRGTGVQVAVVEDDAIYFGHDWLADGSTYDTGGSIGSHATGVAGIIASTGTTYRGVAYNTPALLSANAPSGTDDDFIAATDWAIGQGARVINFSFGVDSTSSMTALDRYVDYITRFQGVTTVKSAGNTTKTCIPEPHNVTSPGKGWNIITVGNFDKHDNTTIADDTMSPTSCYANPDSPHGDREKPEVAAPGTNITTTYCTSSSTCTGTNSGTSFAAPHVTGCAALLMQRNSTLLYWPELVRALLMASAVENLEGDPTLSDKDGAGGVDCHYADQILTGAQGTMSYGLYEASGFPLSYSFNANAGQTVRVVVAWDSNADSSAWPPATDILEADLDLTVYAPNGDYVGGRASWDNAFEIVEFTAPATGTYSANVSAFRFDGSSEYLGFAVWRGARKK